MPLEQEDFISPFPARATSESCLKDVSLPERGWLDSAPPPGKTRSKIANSFKPASRTHIAEVLETLTALGQTSRVEDRYRL